MRKESFSKCEIIYTKVITDGLGSKIQFKIGYLALADVAQWIERQPVNQRVTSLIPSLGHMPGLQARSPVGSTQEAVTH